MIFTKTFAGLQRELENQFAISRTIRHRGERGRQREDGLASFLRTTLPEAYGVATGEIVPYRGEVPSPQCDIIVYDKLLFPILGRSAAVQQVPLEAVYAVIECKSTIDARALRECDELFQRIRALPRCKSSTRRRPGARSGPSYFVFGYSLRTRPERCVELVRSAGRAQDLTIAALDAGLTVFLKDGSQTTPIWLPATAPQAGEFRTLTLFFVLLLETIRMTDLGRHRLIDLLCDFSQ